jgi:hypothetical protein
MSLSGRAVILALALVVGVLTAPIAGRTQDRSDDFKVAPGLLDLILYLDEQKVRAVRRVKILLPRELAMDDSGRVPVIITVHEGMDANLLELRRLNALVLTREFREGVVRASVPLHRVKELARQPWVRGIRLPSYRGHDLNVSGG